MEIVALVGSQRKESVNQKLVGFLQKRYRDQLKIVQAPIKEFPMYNQDNELNPPEIVGHVKQMVRSSDGVLIATPEYNHSIPALLKNALDWFSRIEPVMVNKPVMIIGASPGILGTVRAQEHLRQILKSPGISALTLPGNEVFIGEVYEKIDEQGNITHSPTIEFLDSVVIDFLNWITKTKHF